MNSADCRCGSGSLYSGCCELLHLGSSADTAEALMRSRFSAFALGLDGYLLSTWHPSTRPTSLELDDGIVWRKLQIVDTVAGGPDDATGIVEFRATLRGVGGAAGLLHERSTFSRVDGRWTYLHGDILG